MGQGKTRHPTSIPLASPLRIAHFAALQQGIRKFTEKKTKNKKFFQVIKIAIQLNQGLSCQLAYIFPLTKKKGLSWQSSYVYEMSPTWKQLRRFLIFFLYISVHFSEYRSMVPTIYTQNRSISCFSNLILRLAYASDHIASVPSTTSSSSASENWVLFDLLITRAKPYPRDLPLASQSCKRDCISWINIT